MAASASTSAATDTWIGSNVVNWNSSEWSPRNLPPLSGDILLFGAAGAAGPILNNDLAAGFNLGGITFNASASLYVINGNAITLDGSIVNNGTLLETINLPMTLNVVGTSVARIFTTAAMGADLNLGGVLSGAGGVTKTGAGTLTLANPANTYGGETLIGAGGILNVASVSDYGVASSIGNRLQSSEVATTTGVGIHIQGGTLQYTGSIPQSTNREIRILSGATGATIDASGSTPAATLSFTHTGANTNLFDTAGARTLNLTGTNTGANSFSIRLTDESGNSTSLAKAGTGTWYIANKDNTFTGETVFRGGILNLASLSDYGAASSIGSRTLALENTTATGISLHFQGGTLQYTGAAPQSTNREIRIAAGNSAAIDASGSSPSATLSFTHTGVNKSLFENTGARNLTLTGTNTGNNSFSIQLTDLTAASFTSLTKSGPGTWVLNGPDANTSTGITTVRAGILTLAKTAAQAISGNLAIGDGSARAVVQIGGSGGNQIADSSIAAFSGAGASAGTLRMSNFDETIGGISSLGGEGIIENESGTLGTGTLTLNITGSQTYSGVLRNGDGAGIDGVLAITKAGAGTLILSGTSTHTGMTTVKAGTLTVDGSLSAGSSVSVSNATLNGAGTIAGLVTVANGGILSSSGMVSGNVILASGGVLSGSSTLTGITTAGIGSRIVPGSATTPGALAFTSLILSPGSLIDLEFGATSDVINVTGALALNGGAFNIFAAGGLAPLTANGTYALLDYNTSFTGALSNLSVANSQIGKFYSAFNDIANTVIQLTISDTPVSDWNGSGNNNKWTTAANWTGGLPNATGAIARFGSVATAPAVAVDGPKVLGSILFDNTAAVNYTITGGVADIIAINNSFATALISVAGGAQLIAAPLLLVTNINATTAAGSSLTLSGNITGAMAFTASGAGTTILTGANTFTTTKVTGGILQVGSNGTAGTPGLGDITVEAGGSLVFNRSDNISIASNILGPGAQITKLGAGMLTLAGTNTFATAAGGGFNITSGTVKLGSAAALASGVIIAINGGTLDLNQNNAAISFLSGTSGMMTDSSATAGITLLNIAQTSDSTFNGSLLDGPVRRIGISKSGAGTLALTGSSSSYAGMLAITGGAIVSASSGSIPINANLITLGDGTADVSLVAGAASRQFASSTVVNFTNGSRNARFLLRGSNQTVGGIDSAAAFNVSLATIENDEIGSPGYTVPSGPATLTLNTLTDHSFTGLVRNQNGGALNLIKEGPATQEIRNVLIEADNFGTATINAGKLAFNFELNSNNTNFLGTGTSVLVNANGTLGLNGNWTMSRPISGTGTVLKQGTGTVTLSAVNPFAGTTVISEGSLIAASTTGPSLGGNVTIGTGAQNGIFLGMGAANQFGPDSVLTFNNGTGLNAKFELRGFNQTIAGLSSDPDDTLSIIQNQESDSPTAATLTINAAGNYVFSGLIRTQSGGQISIIKDGPGTQEIRNSAVAVNSFATATINAGKLTFNLSGANNTLSNVTSIAVNNSATLGLDGTWTMNRPVSGIGNVLKQGAGTVIVSGAFSHTGGTTVSDGTLLVTGTISGSVNVTGAASIVGGTGSIGGLTTQSGGVIAPGSNAAGILNTTAGVTLATDTKLSLEINNTAPGSGYDQLNVTGAVNLGNSILSLTGSYHTYPLVANDVFFVVLNDGSDAVNGTFNGVPEGGLITSNIGQYYLLTYQANAGASSFTGGNDVALKAVPEPGAAFSLLAGCGMLLGLRRRREV